jgi:hypothetical protein
MIIIDTHVWLWLLHDPSQLSNAAREQIEKVMPLSTPSTVLNTLILAKLSDSLRNFTGSNKLRFW